MDLEEEIKKRDVIIEKLLEVLKLARPFLRDEECGFLIDGIMSSIKGQE